MKRIYPVVFLSFFLFSFFTGSELCAQRTLQGTVHFKKDKFSLTEDEMPALHQLSDTIQPNEVERILIKGYTDSDADSAYNAKLSLNRCNTVRDYFISDGFDSSSCHIAAFGEYFPIVANDDENSKSKNRRVEIFITLKPPPPNKPCSGDTLIEVAEGVFIGMSKCFPGGKPCIHPTVIKREEHDLKRGILRKLANSHNPYRKNRMSISYYVELNCDKGGCSGEKITVYAPTYDVKGKEVTSQQFDSATAELKPVKSTKIKTLKKKKYAAVETVCPGKPGTYFVIKCGTQNDGRDCNCDPVKLIFKKGIRVDSATSYCGSRTEISSDSSSLSFYAAFGLSSLVVQFGTDTFHIQNVELTELRHGMKRMKRCGIRKGFHLPKKGNKCGFYRIYKLRPSDIDLQKKKPWTMDQTNNGH